MDFRNVTDLFADPAFDGYPVMIREVKGEKELTDQDIHPEEDQDQQQGYQRRNYDQNNFAGEDISEKPEGEVAMIITSTT